MGEVKYNRFTRATIFYTSLYNPGTVFMNSGNAKNTEAITLKNPYDYYVRVNAVYFYLATIKGNLTYSPNVASTSGTISGSGKPFDIRFAIYDKNRNIKGRWSNWTTISEQISTYYEPGTDIISGKKFNCYLPSNWEYSVLENGVRVNHGARVKRKFSFNADGAPVSDGDIILAPGEEFRVHCERRDNGGANNNGTIASITVDSACTEEYFGKTSIGGPGETNVWRSFYADFEMINTLRLDYTLANGQTGTQTFTGNNNIYDMRHWCELNISTNNMITFCKLSGMATGSGEKMFTLQTGGGTDRGRDLQSIDVSELDITNITSLAEMFASKSKLISINFGDNFNTSNITNMNSMFRGCSKLESVDLSTFNTSNVTNMASMFNSCEKLSDFDLSGFDTSKVTTFANMFYNLNTGNHAPLSLELTNFDVSSATSMASMFNGARVNTLNLISFYPNDNCNIGNMFDESNSYGRTLTTIYCNHAWSDDPNSILNKSSNTFIYCSNLVGDIRYSSDKVDGVYATPYEGYFTPWPDCTLYYTYDGQEYSITKSGEDNLQRIKQQLLEEAPDIDLITNCRLVGGGLGSAEEFFKDFVNCDTFDLSEFDWRFVNNGRSMFENAGYNISLEDINLNLGDVLRTTDNLTDTSSMFENMKGISAPDISAFSLESVTNASRMFKNAEFLSPEYGLTAAWIGEYGDLTKCSDMSEMFDGCNLYSIYIGLPSISTAPLVINGFLGPENTDMSNMFSNMPNVEMISIPFIEFNTDNVSFTGMFENDLNLETIFCNSDFSEHTTDSISDIFGNNPVLEGTYVSYDPNYNKIDKANPDTGYFTWLRPLNIHFEYTDGDSYDATVYPWPPYIGPDYQGSAVTVLREFIEDDHDKIKGIELSGYTDLTDLSGLLGGLPNLETVNVDELNLMDDSVCDNMFSNNPKLESIICSYDWKEKYNITGEDMFINSPELKGAIEYDSDKINEDYANPATGYFNPTNIITVIYKDLDGNTHTVIFTGSDNMEDLKNYIDDNNLRDEITEVIIDGDGSGSMKDLFKDCSNLESVNLNDLLIEDVTSLESTFENCENLKEVFLKGMEPNVESAANMFKDCPELERIYCEKDWSTTLPEDADTSNMFDGDISLIGAIPYDQTKTDGEVANPITGYFTIGFVLKFTSGRIKESLVTNIPSTTTYDIGVEVTIPSTAPSTTGATFIEWNTSYYGDGDTYNPGDIITMENDVLLYAIWTGAAIYFNGKAAYNVYYNGAERPADHVYINGRKIY